jgi:hypothetical protein
MSNIDHQLQGGELTIWTYPANGSRYAYVFDENGDLTDKYHITDPATSAEEKRRVTPDLTPRVKEYIDKRDLL